MFCAMATVTVNCYKLMQELSVVETFLVTAKALASRKLQCQQSL